MRYAPSTIAISALLLTFSKLRLDCTEWLHRLPDECLPPKTMNQHQMQHSIFPIQDVAYLDIDNCLLCLQKIPMPIKYINLLSKGLHLDMNAINLSNRMDLDNSSPSDSDTDGPSSVRTITPTSTAELNEERSSINKSLESEKMA